MDCRISNATSRFVLFSAVTAAVIGFVVGSSSPLSLASQPLHQHDHEHEGHIHEDERATERMPPEMHAMMERWMEHAELRPEHAAMQKNAGTWLVSAEYRMAPGAPPEESVMIAQIRPVMGGRFMIEDISGVMETAPGQQAPWSGMAISGYDNRLEKHTFVWFDSAGTSMTTGYGDQTGPNEWTYEYEMYDPMVGAVTQRKNVITVTAPDRHTFDMHTKQPDGSWFKNMTMEYTRAG